MAACVALAACGGGGGGGGAGGGGNSNAPPTVSLTVNPNPVLIGRTATLTWTSSSGTTGCLASGGWSGDRPTSGSEITPQLVGTTTFTLHCFNVHGETAVSRTVTITPPSLVFTATPAVVLRGQPVTLQWNAVGPEQCQAGWGNFPFERPISGSEQLFPSQLADGRLEWQLELQCSGPGHSLTRFVNFKVKGFVGQLLFPSRIAFEGDINDPDAPVGLNDSIDEANHFPFLHVRPGYVNQPQTGPPGRSFASGDLTDFHYTDGFDSGELTIRLTMPGISLDDPVGVRADADLYVYHSNGSLIDASVGTGREEEVVVPADDSFFIEVRSVTGSVPYLLQMFLRQTQAEPLPPRLDDVIPDEAIVVLRQAAANTQASKAGADFTLQRLGLQRRAGEAGRELRVAFPGALSAIAEPRGTHMTPAQSRRLATLLRVKQLQATPGIRSASPNRIYRTLFVPDDPLFPYQRWHYDLIHLPEAWDITTGAPEVTVAVVDTGVVRNHPDLEPNLRDGYDLVSDPTNSDLDGPDPDFDDPGLNISGRWILHGTHVAGTIGAIGNNGQGVSGVASGVTIMPVRALDRGSGTLYDVLQGVRYAARLPNDSGTVPIRRADIVNLSIGAATSCEQVEADLYLQLRAAGIVVVGAAGNAGLATVFAPASCPGVLSVAAVGAGSERAYYSNFGQLVDLAAPGGDMRFDANFDGLPDGVMSTHASGPRSMRTLDYFQLQGTSMATPHVAGVMALMKSVNPALGAADIETMLAAGVLTDDLGPLGRDDLGYGLINAYKSVRAAQGIFDSPPQLIVTPGALLYGGNQSAAALQLRNGGTGLLTVQQIVPDVPWITVVPASVNAAGLGTYDVRIDRSQVAAGSDRGVLEIVTSAGSRFVPVIITENAGIGFTLVPLYVMVKDVATGQTWVQRVVRTGPRYEFRFDDLPPGRYVVVGGTDINHDGDLCDPGEVCGGFPDFAFPEIIDYTDVREAIDVPMEPTALHAPSESAVSSP